MGLDGRRSSPAIAATTTAVTTVASTVLIVIVATALGCRICRSTSAKGNRCH